MEFVKNDLIEIDITDAGFNGEGIGHYEGTTVFVPFALKGERVRAHVLKVKNNLVFARLSSVLIASPFRVPPICEYFTKCGGCSLQNTDYETQLLQKTEAVKTTLYKVLGEVSVKPCVNSEPSLGYRNKASFPARGNPAELGFYSANSHRHIPIKSCPVGKEFANKILNVFNAYFAAEKVSGYDEESGKGEVRHVTAREIDGHKFITMVVTSAFKRDTAPLKRILDEQFADDYVLYLNFNDKKNNVILGKYFKLACGKERAVHFEGIRFTHHPAAFFQINDDVNKKIIERVISFVGGCKKVADCYCGSGLMSVMLARKCGKVIGIEIVEQAVESARETARLNGIENAEFISGDCAEKMRDIRADAIVLDPPRSGCATAVLQAVKSSGAKKVAYVSCNPATLARDIKELSSDFKLLDVTPFDMFAQTGEVECLALLERI